ncbi:MAG: hypothetical protein FIB01_08625, partial [Gemmatimonadetes bacterium]|nr:hypothetical protein [Gemmatimonadota bacterium]
MSGAERRYTDQEFAAIIEAAAAQPAGAARALPARSGLTLAELQAIAAEVGVAPDAVARVARLLPLQPASEAARLAGGPATVQLEFALETAADEDAANRAVAAIRRIVAQQGTMQRTGSVVEWRSDPGTSTLAVNITTAENGTRVSLLLDRRGTAALLTASSILGAGISFGLTGAILEPTGVVAIGALALGIGGTAAVAARAIWSGSTRRWLRLLARLTGGVAEALEPPAP